jgi:ribonuclease P protein component
VRFSTNYRFQSAADFTRVMKKPAYNIKKGCFLLLATENSLENSRLGVIVAKKKIKKSTQRNTIKRLMRESFRLSLSKFNSFDIVILVCHSCSTIKKQQIWHDLEQLWVNLQHQSS